MRIQQLSVLFGIAVMLSTTGCATIVSLEEDGKNKIFSGTAKHFELACAHATCLDFPFSLVADTVLLPYTVPLTIHNYATNDKSKSKMASNNHGGSPRSPGQRR